MNTIGPGVRSALGRWARQWWSRALVQVAPPARRRLEARLLGEVYAPVLAPSLREQLAAAPRLLAGRYLAVTVRRAERRAASPEPDGARFAAALAALRDRYLHQGLLRLCTNRGLDPGVVQDELRTAARVEYRSGQPGAGGADLSRLVELTPASTRFLRQLLSPPGRRPPELAETLAEMETLAYLAADVAEVRAGSPPAAANAYAALARQDPDSAAAQLQELVERHRTRLDEQLTRLDPTTAADLRQRIEPLLLPLRDPLPDPPPAAAPAPEGVSSAVVLFGMLCVLGWLVAYASIIVRGFADHTYGVPLAALAANITWEFTYGFLLDPLGDYFHTSSIFGFLVDVVIVAQAFAYGGAQFPGTLLEQHFGWFFAACIVVALPVVYFGFLDLEDPDGEYTGFGINLMMSILYLAMLSSRGSGQGQSMYIAIGKWVGTFCAWAATALTVTTTPAQTWPSSWRAFARGTIGNRSYPLTPLINVMYGWTFVLDAAYTVQLYRRLRADGVAPWRRF